MTATFSCIPAHALNGAVHVATSKSLATNNVSLKDALKPNLCKQMVRAKTALLNRDLSMEGNHAVQITAILGKNF